ncbi:MAG: hypothetical protein BWK78_04325 [Thiotrichaceae bacterium IS1]|nr:MAG: hypothetical protein BWK78_04325 [Thiotrichaceae bacterium IS1]
MIGFGLTNLLIPNDPESLRIQTQNGTWVIAKERDFANKKQQITERRTVCLETYSIEFKDNTSSEVAGLPFSRILTLVKEEARPICLSLSYLTGSAVTFSRPLPQSDVDYISDGLPRMRGLSSAKAVTTEPIDFEKKVNLMVNNFAQNVQQNCVDIIIHHLLDATYWWSLEDLFLSTCTILEIIKQNQIKQMGPLLRKEDKNFYNAIKSMAERLGLTILSHDFVDMRNDLIHEGHLSKNKFANHSKSDCANVVCDVLNWIDEYVHSILRLGAVTTTRYPQDSLEGINSYTTWDQV